MKEASQRKISCRTEKFESRKQKEKEGLIDDERERANQRVGIVPLGSGMTVSTFRDVLILLMLEVNVVDA